MKFKLSEQARQKINQKVTKIETKGFLAANKIHKYGINGCLIFIGYQLFAFLRDYNDFFLHARQINQLDEQVANNSGPINQQTAKEWSEWCLYWYNLFKQNFCLFGWLIDWMIN